MLEVLKPVIPDLRRLHEIKKFDTTAEFFHFLQEYNKDGG
jgi:hypothetical protein